MASPGPPRSRSPATRSSWHLIASGLEPGAHPAHLHGKLGLGGTLLPPTTPADLDHDEGYIETPDAEPAIGPPLMTLGNFGVGGSGMLDVIRRYTVNTSTSMPRQFLTFEMHGLSVPERARAGTPHEVNGIGGYKVVVPIGGAPLALGSAAVPTATPEPATYALCGGALGLLALVRRRARA